MGLFQKRGKWFIDYTYHGKRVRECVGTSKRMAENALAVRKTELLQGRYQMKKIGNIRFSEFAKTYMEYAKVEKKSWLRDQVALNSMLPHLGNYYLNAITARIIEEYKAHRSKEVKPATTNRDLSTLRHLLNTAVKWEMLAVSPYKNIRFLRVDNVQDRILSDEEVGKLLRSCNGHVYSIVLTALHTGMRLNEILTLKWSNIDLEQKGITLINTKNNRTRKIPINSVMMELLSGIKAKSNSEYVFVFDRSNLPVASIKTAFNKAIKRAGIPHLKFHSLRHTFSSNLVKAGVDLVTVKDLLGHQSITTTMRYAHSAPESKQRAVAVLEKLVRDGDVSEYDTKLTPRVFPPNQQPRYIIKPYRDAAVAQLVERRTRNA